jgi:hypothetical protein
MRAARQVLERLEETLRGAVESVGRLLPGKLQPLELAAELARAMDRSRMLSSQETYVANRYRLLLAPADLELFGGLHEELEAEFARDLREHAEAREYVCGPRLRVKLEADPSLTSGRVRVESEFDREPVPARLSVVGGLPPHRYEIQGTVTLGRSDSCEVQLDEPAISRQHARLEWTYAGYVLHDLGSSNGAFVNGQVVTEALLQNGDLVEMGLVQLQFSYAQD